MDQREDPLLCHELIDDMERLCLEQHNVHLVIHYDPIVIGDPLQDALHETVKTVLGDYDERLTFHDFRMVKGKGHTNLIFDIALPQDLRGQEKAIKRAIKAALEAQYQDKYYIVVAFDPQAFN
jgi:divalent metal cation (Fe/Co/Zn/Cd) transporter